MLPDHREASEAVPGICSLQLYFFKEFPRKTQDQLLRAFHETQWGMQGARAVRINIGTGSTILCNSLIGT